MRQDSIFKKAKWYGMLISAVFFGGFILAGWFGIIGAIEPGRNVAQALWTLKAMGGFFIAATGAGLGLVTYLSDHRQHQLLIAEYALDQMDREKAGLERLVRRTRSALKMSGVVTADPFNPAEQLILDRLREDIEREVNILNGNVEAAQSIDDKRRAQMHADKRI